VHSSGQTPIGSTRPHDLRGRAGDNCSGWDVAGNDCSRPNDCILADAQARQNHGTCANHDAIADFHTAAQGGGGGKVHTVAHNALVVDIRAVVQDARLSDLGSSRHSRVRENLTAVADLGGITNPCERVSGNCDAQPVRDEEPVKAQPVSASITSDGYKARDSVEIPAACHPALEAV
jgi:hypothetical protein